MKKTKLITSLVISAGLITTAGISAIAITSCSLENDYMPDASTKIMEVVPNKETFEKMKESLAKLLEEYNKDISNGIRLEGTIKIYRDTFYIIQKINSKVISTMKFVFDKTNKVKLIIDDPNEPSSSIITIEEAKLRIYNATGFIK